MPERQTNCQFGEEKYKQLCTRNEEEKKVCVTEASSWKIMNRVVATIRNVGGHDFR
jgi:hypothetical protein